MTLLFCALWKWDVLNRAACLLWRWFVAKPWYVCLCCMGAWTLLEFLLISGYPASWNACYKQRWLAFRGITVHLHALVLFPITVSRWKLEWFIPYRSFTKSTSRLCFKYKKASTISILEAWDYLRWEYILLLLNRRVKCNRFYGEHYLGKHRRQKEQKKDKRKNAFSRIYARCCIFIFLKQL